MTTLPDLPTPITPDPADLPVEPDQGPGTVEVPSDPSSPFTMQPERAVARFSANRSFMQAAAFCWPAFRAPVVVLHA